MIKIPHYMLIQSAYDDPEMSRQRLEISRNTSVVSLSYQTQKPIVHLVVHQNDPMQADRIALFESSGCTVRTIVRDKWKLYGEDWDLPDGRKIVSRLDDDDVICREFCKRTRLMAPLSGEHSLVWPRGYVFWRESVFMLKHVGNQFVSLVTSKNTDPHQQGHWLYHHTWNTVKVTDQVGWIWVRHGIASTTTLRKYRKKLMRGIDSNRIPVNLRAILRSISSVRVASGDYEEHNQQKTDSRQFLQDFS